MSRESDQGHYCDDSSEYSQGAKSVAGDGVSNQNGRQVGADGLQDFKAD